MTNTANLPGPRTDYAKSEPTPWRTNDGIVKFIEFPARLPTISRRAFHLYWSRHHSTHVMNIAAFSQFMRKYNSGHTYEEPVAGLPDHYQQTTPFDGAAEVWINSLDEVGAWLGHPSYAELIQPDEGRFIRQDGVVEIVVTKEERILEPEPDLNENGLTKLYVLLGRRLGLDRDAFHAAISAYGRDLAVDTTHLRKLVISHRIDKPWPEGMVLADIDAVLELWFTDRHALQAYYAGPATKTAVERHEKTCCDTGRIRAIVARMRVVHDEFSFQPSTMQPLAWAWES
jgi:hypothetical protein